ncbi:MAG: DegQ family serine endoprotease [Syntrophales bacterium]|nr:DegQ family serine endoprotease [Syntrophales bacterium]MDY0045486.1 DegQ family serine endoprotease [Syntrophales bacterium]
MKISLLKKRVFRHAGVLLAVTAATIMMSTANLLPFNYLSNEAAYAAVQDTKDFIQPSFADLAEKLKPSVVNISTTKIVAGGQYFSSPFKGSPFERFFGGDDFFRRFFGDMPGREYRQRSLGSGFIISKDGYIFTNNHVIEKADEIMVKLSTGKEYKAKVKGTDKNTDIALLKIDPDGDLPVAALGNSSDLRVGEWVIAIGNPFGLSQTVTAGIVSATGRVIGAGPYDDFIQTDASINPGNSGGPLFNLAGEVVGINTAIIAQGQGIGFATPVDVAKSVLPDLKKEGKVTRGWLGVSVQDVSEDIAESLDLQKKVGVLVADAFEGDPAAKAGIKSGDIIISVNGKEVKDTHELLKIVAAIPVGKEVPVEVIRDGDKRRFSVTVTARPEKDVIARGGDSKKWFGMTVQEINPEISEHFGLSETSGVIVSEVDPGSPASQAGVQSGDIILQVNKIRINSLKEYSKTLSNINPEKGALFLIERENSRFFVVLKP